MKIKIPIKETSTLICKADYSRAIRTAVASILALTMQENADPEATYRGIPVPLMIDKIIQQLGQELLKEGLTDCMVNFTIRKKNGMVPEIHYLIGEEENETD